jgi:hypothetical protein
VLEVPAGFSQFAERFKHYQKLFNIEWPAVNVEYRDVCVSTQVRICCQMTVLECAVRFTLGSIHRTA